MRSAVAVLLCVLAAAGAGADAPAKASVFLDTEPLGARIILDGKLLAQRTPVLLRGLADGEHRVQLSRDGWLSVQATFTTGGAEVPVVQEDLPSASVVLAFPGSASLQDPQGSSEAPGKQFRVPAGSYEVTPSAEGSRLEPVFGDEGLLTVAAWALAIVSSAAAVSIGSDVYHIVNGWTDHPSFVSIALLGTGVFELPWYFSLAARKARFLRDTAPTVSAMPARLDLARDLFSQGDEALQAGDLAKAEPLLAQLVAEYPESRLVPAAWFRLARIHTISGRRDLAAGEYRLVAETYPQAEFHDKARKALADLDEAAGRAASALANLDAMVLADGFFDPADIDAQRARLAAAPEAPRAP